MMAGWSHDDSKVLLTHYKEKERKLEPEQKSYCWLFPHSDLKQSKLLHKILGNKSLTNSNKGLEFPLVLENGFAKIIERSKVLDCFHTHFIASGSLFVPSVQSVGQDLPSLFPFFVFLVNLLILNCSLFDVCVTNWSNFNPVFAFEVHKYPELLDTTKAAGPDKSYFLKLASDFIAQPLTRIFNLCLVTNVIRLVWKSAYVLSSFKLG